MYCETSLGHIETRRFHAGRSISTCHVEFIDAVRRDESRKRLAGKGIALRLHEDIIRNDLHFRHQFLALAARLEHSRSSGDVVMLDVDHMHPLGHSPFDGGIDISDDVSIVFGDVVLDVDNDKCSGVHHSSMMKLRG